LEEGEIERPELEDRLGGAGAEVEVGAGIQSIVSCSHLIIFITRKLLS
jgi:hypothetical protein